MENLKELIARQRERAANIEKAVANIKKTPHDRRSVEYYTKKSEDLNAQWKAFDTAENIIRNDPMLSENDPYIVENIHKSIAIVHNTAIEELEQLIQGLSRQTKPLPAERGAGLPTGNQSASTSYNIHGLIRRQGALKSSLKRLLQSSSTKEAPVQSLSAIDRLWQKIETIHLDIWEICANPAAEGYDCEDYEALEENVTTQIASLSKTQSNESITSEPVQQPKDRANLQLPKISIPRFNGDCLTWQPFSDIFSKMIHEQDIPAIQKMWYLKANLSGEAERLIRHLDLTEGNYTTAWNTLKDRYDNKRVLVSTIIQKLFGWGNLTAESKSLKEFHDVLNESLSALRNIGINIDNWDPVLLHVLVKKLDRQTHIIYEQSLEKPTELQTLNHFLKVLQNRFQALEAVGGRDKPKQIATTTTYKSSGCPLCTEGHQIYYCKQFLAMGIADRLKWVQRKRFCVNCIKPDHRTKECTYKACTKCSLKHNSLLHLGRQQNSSNQPSKSGSESLPSTSVASANARPASILLATAVIKITANNGRSGNFRALLDSGSQINIVTERLIKTLSIQPERATLGIQGIGGRSRQATQRVNVKFESITRKFSSRLEAYVLPNIIPPQPSASFDISSWSIPENLMLADPSFQNSAKIDVLLGAEFYFPLLLSGTLHLADNLPILRNTKLGWIASGRLTDDSKTEATCAVFSADDISTNELLERFWKIEDVPAESNLTVAEQACETHFTQTTTRDISGRFVVRLPLSEDAATLGESETSAYSRFLALERRFKRDNNLEKQYKDFMQSYEDLGHMTQIDPKKLPGPRYYIPHHCVLRPESSTTKLRVVFDASAKTSTNRSLNDILLTGPTVQGDIFGMLLRFRLPRFVFTTDIEKMYRQILVDERDRSLQLILWRDNPGQPVKHFQLNTVTYGTSSAPYLATKCLQRLAAIRMDKYPLGATILSQDFYVDDGMSGSDSLITAKEMQSQLTSLLKEAGFKLRKWCANHRQLLQDIPQDDQEVNLDFENSSIKALGLIWRPASDQFCLRANLQPASVITKRSVISDVARIYDPLGMAGPVVVAAKIFTQQLWEDQISWDDELPEDLKTKWHAFRKALNMLDNTRIPRHVFNGQPAQHIQMHVFVDASEKAYGAAIYIRSQLANRRITVRLLCAKSKVAPLQRLSLPRLELCAALLGAELASKAKGELRYEDKQLFFWSDSEIVLHWINSASSSLKTFVANRISKIQDLTINSQWRHVNSKDNPADLISRGIRPEQLPECNMWFYGPLFLHGNEDLWPKKFTKELHPTSDLEFKRKPVIVTAAAQMGLEEIIYKINHRNSFECLQRVVAYMQRFIKHTRASSVDRPATKLLSPTELTSALHLIVRTIQTADFKDDINKLKTTKELSRSSPIISLSPFLDESDILRVGGRLEASNLSYEEKHQMILPYNDPIVKLILVMLHNENHHCGPQTLLNITRERGFWVIKGKTMARNTVHNCIRCTKAKPKLYQQIMGDLPEDRITPCRPFLKTGVDYCGPFWVHYKLRGKRPHKVYIAVFCCFATKAIHMEVVTDLTTDAFIGALKRFISRRGRCQTIYSDNGTNFVGARNQLKELDTSIFGKESQETIGRACSKQMIEFKFIPPRAPHFGGLWEAAVKSAKHLLLRSVSTASLTHEELETVVIEIEAILNSRPLTPISSNPNDLTALTPGHFLIGEPLISQIDARTNQPSTPLSKRWKLVSELRHSFWNRWSSEYLSQLQQRHKWKAASANIKPDQLVIIKEDNIPVMQWPLGRILKIYKGQDGNVRVVDVKTSSGVIKRPIHRLAPLLNDDPEGREEPKGIKRATEQEPNTTKRSRPNNFNLLCTTLLALLILPVVLCNPMQPQPFDTNPGLYFEGIGTARIATAEWKLMVYYNLITFRSEIDDFADGIKMFSDLCKISPQEAICNNFVSHLKQIQADLIQDRDIIMPRRLRRGALNIVGNVARSLFGMLDADYAAEMDNTIQRAEMDRSHLSSLLHNQTSIIDSTLNIIREDEFSLKTRMKEVQDTISTLHNQVLEAESQLRRAHTTALLSNELTLAATRLRQVEAEIIDVLTDSHHGRISPSLLTPDQLQREINVIKAHLPLSRVLPFDDTDLIQFYKIMRAKAAVTKDKVMFEIRLPLVDQQTFELLKIFGVPANKNGTLVAIHPQTEYLAINLHRDEYIPLSNDDIRNCIQPSSDIFICDNNHAIFSKGSMAASCEVDLFRHKPTNRCKLHTYKEPIIWQQLHHKNQWIYATTNETDVSTVCGTKIIQYTLQGSGIINLEPSCTLKTSEVTLRGHYNASSFIQASYPRFPKFNLTTHDREPTAILNSTSQLLINHTEQLTELQNKLHDADISTAYRFDKHHHLAISYTALLMSSMLLIFYLVWRCMKRGGESIQPPTPQPRQTAPDMYTAQSPNI